MAFSSNYQIKLIGTGDESGTWGTSTNNNLERIEQSLGQAVRIDVESPPNGSTWAPNVMTWITSDTANVNIEGSEGRAKYVEFVSGSNLIGAVTVLVRGATAGVLPNRIYFVTNNINNVGNVNAKLTLDAGSGAKYVIESGASALVVINGTSVVGGLPAGRSFNALKNLQVDTIRFPTGSIPTITMPDNRTNALTVESTDTNSEFLRFDTSNNHLEIAPGSAVNNIELRATDITTSTQATAVTIINSVANALDVKTAAKSLVNLNTSTDTLTLSTNTINLDDPGGTRLTLLDGAAGALQIFKPSGEFLRIDTNAGSNTQRLLFLQSQCDLVMQSGNILQIGAGSTLDVDGSATFANATITTADINGGTIDATNIRTSSIESTSIGGLITGPGAVASVRASTYAVPLANYEFNAGGYVWEDSLAGRAGFTKVSADTPVMLRQTGAGNRGFITSSEMVTSTPVNQTGYFRGEFVFTNDNQQRVIFAHNILDQSGVAVAPSRVEWNLVADAEDGTGNYDVGDMITMSSVWDTDDVTRRNAIVTTWKSTTQVGWNYYWLRTERIRIVDKLTPTTTHVVNLANWKIVVEAWA